MQKRIRSKTRVTTCDLLVSCSTTDSQMCATYKVLASREPPQTTRKPSEMKPQDRTPRLANQILYSQKPLCTRVTVFFLPCFY